MVVGRNRIIGMPDQDVVSFAGRAVAGISFLYTPDVATPIAGHGDDHAGADRSYVVTFGAQAVVIGRIHKIESVRLTAVGVPHIVAIDRIVPVPFAELPGRIIVEREFVITVRIARALALFELLLLRCYLTVEILNLTCDCWFLIGAGLLQIRL